MSKEKKFDYLSVFSPNELFRGDIKQCQKQLKKATDIDTREKLENQIKLYEQFNPSIYHNRKVAQVITINVLNNPIWQSRKYGNTNLKLPNIDYLREDKGVEQIITIDYGKIAQDISNGIMPEENDYIQLKFNQEDFNKGKIICLKLLFAPSIITLPIVYNIKEYISIDDIIIEESQSIHRPGFNGDKFIEYIKNAK